MSTSDAPPMVKALLADPKANLIMQLILNNRIGEFRQGLNKGVVKGYPVDFFPEEYINLYSIHAVPYANKKDPSVNIDDWLNELEFMRMKMKNMAEVEEEDRALNREKADKRGILISNAPYDTEITEEEYNLHVPASQKYLWKVSRTVPVQTKMQEYREEKFYKKYRPGESPAKYQEPLIPSAPPAANYQQPPAAKYEQPLQYREPPIPSAPPAANYQQPPAAKYEQPLQYREPPIPSAPPAAANYQQPPQYNISPLQRLDLQLAQLYAKKGEIDFTTDLDQNQKEIFSRTTPKERVQLKAKYGKKMGFFNQATNLGRRLFSWGGRGKISRKSIMAKLSCPRCTRSCRTMGSMMKHLKSAHGMTKTAARACCKRAMKAATRKAKGSRKSKKGTRRR